MSELSDAYAEIGDFLGRQYADLDLFCCIYGSFPAQRETSKSDIDLFVAVSDPTKVDFRSLVDFVLLIHRKRGLEQDEEVPYENKLLVSYADIAAATDLKPFYANGELFVRPVEKTKAFLSSEEIKQRLLLNALTTPHDCIVGNRLMHMEFRAKAERGLYQLASTLSQLQSPDVDDLVEVLLRDTAGNEGEWYLGYKDYDTVRAYLKYILSKNHD